MTELASANAWPMLLAMLAVGYLLGSLPFGLIVTRLAGLGDIRKIGSGNIGATNVLRTGNKKLAAATLLLDGLKGFVAVLIGGYAGGFYGGLAAGLGAVLGHLFPVWLGFRGGKGVATYIGVLLGLYWPGAIAFCVTWLVVAAVARYSSLAALVASAVVPCLLWWIGETRMALLFLVFTVLLFWRHANNIGRLLRGEEGRIGAKKT